MALGFDITPVIALVLAVIIGAMHDHESWEHTAKVAGAGAVLSIVAAYLIAGLLSVIPSSSGSGYVSSPDLSFTGIGFNIVLYVVGFAGAHIVVLLVEKIKK